MVLAAGVAQADVSFSGKGEVSVAQADGTKSMSVRSGYDLNVAVSGASDNGITYSMGFDMGAGDLIDYNDDYEIDPQLSPVGTSALTIGYAGVTIVVGQNEVDDLYDDQQNGDVGISGSFGSLNFSAVADTDDGASSNSFSLSGSADAITWGFVTTDNNAAVEEGDTDVDDNGGESASKVTVGYTVSDALSLSFKHDTKGSSADAVNTLGATYAMGSLTLGLSGADDDTTDFSVGYAAGPMSVTYATDESDNWEFDAAYDLGGGATAFASMDHADYTAVGLSFAF